jgi:hypothetical protein
MTVLDRLDHLQDLITASKEFLGQMGSNNGSGPSINLLCPKVEDKTNNTCPAIELAWQGSRGNRSAKAEFSYQQDTVWLMVEAFRVQADGKKQSLLLPQILPWTKRIPLEFRDLIFDLQPNGETVH